MYKEYLSFDELKQCVIADKRSVGVDAYTRNRYPIRFVLFDNFQDSSSFVEFLLEERHVVLESVGKWLDVDYPDIMITHTQLAEKFKDYIKCQKGNDCVIAPFSELARFYDNDVKKAFDALLKTIKAIEASAAGVEQHQRVYVPIVGLEGKMETFCNDSQSTIWRLKSADKELAYRLVLTNDTTFGVKGLDARHTVVGNMQEWLNLWKDHKRQTVPNIICTSSSIFANAKYAQPDNAFSYVSCSNAYEFLTVGLQLQFGNVQRISGDDEYWNQLAADIDIEGAFSFKRYVEDYFSVNAIDSYRQFVKLWFEHPGSYEKWLLATFYKSQDESNAFICRILASLDSLIGNEFVEKVAFEMTSIDTEIEVRRYCLSEAMRHNVVLSESAAVSIRNRLENIEKQYGVSAALRYFTGISSKEKELAVAWLANRKLEASQIKAFFPDLYSYISEPIGVVSNSGSWVDDYIREYKDAKLCNHYTKAISDLINQCNSNEVAFDKWYQQFSTVRTLLANRKDIEVFYWVDGLGIDWIPLVKEFLKEKKEQNIFLNEIKIARSLLPSTTAVNKADLQKLLPDGCQLQKAGDLDSFAHQPTNAWPVYIIKELQLVRNIIDDITNKYNGKKIAIISDHGLSYLPQLCDGLGLAGVKPDHHGRVAIKEKGTISSDSNYIRLNDNTMACSLTHKSLCSKVPKGQGIHGGCTPEEVLVPIFIISSYINAAEWDAELLTTELSGSDPILKFRIKNLPTSDIPYVEYNGKRYEIYQSDDKEVYYTNALCVDAKCTTISLIIGDVNRIFNISVSTGAVEDDLFSDF